MKRLFSLTVSLFVAISFGGAQQPGDLQQQLEELKQQYAETTRALEQRIAALEQQIEKVRVAAAAVQKEGTVSTGELIKEAAERPVRAQSGQVGETFQGAVPSEPTYDLLREADHRIGKLEDQVGAFDFHGYFRSGYGLNGVGGQQVAFQAPGAGASRKRG